MSEYWTNTKANPRMFRPSYQTPEMDKHIRETVGIDPAILAAELGWHEGQVLAYQRQLGVRRITTKSDYQHLRTKK
jgi:hypothetical protein